MKMSGAVQQRLINKQAEQYLKPVSVPPSTRSSSAYSSRASSTGNGLRLIAAANPQCYLKSPRRVFPLKSLEITLLLFTFRVRAVNHGPQFIGIRARQCELHSGHCPNSWRWRLVSPVHKKRPIFSTFPFPVPSRAALPDIYGRVVVNPKSRAIIVLGPWPIHSSSVDP